MGCVQPNDHALRFIKQRKKIQKISKLQKEMKKDSHVKGEPIVLFSEQSGFTVYFTTRIVPLLLTCGCRINCFYFNIYIVSSFRQNSPNFLIFKIFLQKQGHISIFYKLPQFRHSVVGFFFK